eukprot:TRINITY_DN8469_c0_g2_i1.p1 TRINITY_DN8469_c0_g2~~TRINITY_DN8469_c0_g2_i1.p1  ORF type:complete len:442 (+),score=151.18 TRINITY_DN8469_c0_g2_i1:31-1326(+)
MDDQQDDYPGSSPYEEKGVGASPKLAPSPNLDSQQLNSAIRSKAAKTKTVSPKGKVAGEEASVDKGAIVEKMRQQNAKLKAEFALLRDKLEECIEKAKNGSRLPADKPTLTEEELAREQEMKKIQQKISYYKKQTETMKKQLEGALNIDKIVALENEEVARRKVIQELESEKNSLLRIQREQSKAMDVMANERELKKRRDQLKEELRNKKNELKEKQGLLRRQEKQMKEQHEAYINLEEKCRKLQGIINNKRAGLSLGTTEIITEGDVQTLEDEIKTLELSQSEEKKKYKQMIATQENRLKELTGQIDALNLELKQKDQECRLNTLKISELKRQIRLGVGRAAVDKHEITPQELSEYTKNVEQMKRDMEAEKISSGSRPADITGSEAVQDINIDQPLANDLNEDFGPGDGGKEEMSVFSKPNIGVGRRRKE